MELGKGKKKRSHNSPFIQGGASGQALWSDFDINFGCSDHWLFLPAWNDGKLADVAEELGNMVEPLETVNPRCPTLYMATLE